jgi:hypothetical protein
MPPIVCGRKNLNDLARHREIAKKRLEKKRKKTRIPIDSLPPGLRCTIGKVPCA